MQKAEKMQELRVFAQEIRVETLKTVGSLGFGHVPGAMSVIDALAVLYGEVMKVDPKNPHWEDRDWCVLSKGHAGPAMYATLGLKGFYPVEEAYTLRITYSAPVEATISAAHQLPVPYRPHQDPGR